MVNRETNFNRKKVQKLKTIRDKKRTRITKKKNILSLNEKNDKPLTKKQEKRQKNLGRIYKDLDQAGTILKEKSKKRRGKRGGLKHKKVAKATDMVVEN